MIYDDRVRLKKDLIFRITPLYSPPVLHKHFEAGRVGKVIHATESSKGSVFPFSGSVVVLFDTSSTPISDIHMADYSVSFFGDAQIDEYLEKVEK
jgi:hypothetical protein